MTTRFLVDAQLPVALARTIVEHGHEAVHVFDLDLGSASDAAICDYAIEHRFAVVTKDEDFVERIHLGRVSPSVVWVRLGNTRKLTLLTWFIPQLERIASLVESGEKLIELR